MLHVLRHYLPLHKALLILSETVVLTAVVLAVLSAHLWVVDDEMRRALAVMSLSPTQALWRCVLSSVLVAALAQIAISFNDLYDFRVSGSSYERAARFLGSAGSGVLLVVLAASLAEVWEVDRVLDFPGLPFSQRVVLLSAALGAAFALLYIWRNVFHALLRRTTLNQRVIILGSGRLAHRLADEIGGRENSGIQIAAMISPASSMRERRRGAERREGEERRGGGEPTGTGNPWYDATSPDPARQERRSERAPEAAPKLMMLHTSDRNDPTTAVLEPAGEERMRKTELDESLSSLVKRLNVSDIVIAFEDRRGSLPTEELLRCRMEGVAVHEAESFFEQVTGKIPAEAMRPSYLIFNKGFVQHPAAELAKRLFDIAFAVVVLVLSLPFMLGAALAIRLDSPGPILFRQERTGRGGRTFTLCKFRSMRTDAEKHTGPVWAQANDPRVTRVGRFLRKSRIDELPQIFNVLAGSMSFAGPRPERPEFVAELAQKIPYYEQRHIVQPGLTGWAQINYPYGNTVEDALQKLQYDLFYIKYQSLLFDLSIIANTVKTVVLRKGT